jgi:hypothetical protein
MQYRYHLFQNYSHIISTDEDPGLRIESFAVINLRGVTTNKTIIFYYSFIVDLYFITLLLLFYNYFIAILSDYFITILLIIL